ncbi:MAG: LCP family protein [Chloroflexota bacterium]|nr:LCP family protein [Chloroflexota bacterium]
MAGMAAARARTQKRRRRVRLALLLIALVLLTGGIAAYVLTSRTIDHISQGINHIFQTPVRVRPASAGQGRGTPVPVVLPDWSKKEPVNILLIGLDYRPQEKDSRADTQIIVHIDPVGKSVALVSIPRDLWLTIPGYGEDRVNAAFQKGEDEAAKVPGGGPGLAMATIEYNFGVHVDYFAQVDFHGFEQIVDTVGGINIDVPKPLVDNSYPFNDYGYTRVYIPAGLQHLDGRTALQYARSRHADSDIGRNARQQQVLLAIRQQGLNLNLLTHINDLVDQMSSSVKTDLSLEQVLSLVQLSREISSNSVQNVLIDNSMVKETILPSGADVLMPNWDLIRPKLTQAFADPRLAREGARLEVQNGTSTAGIARKLGDTLEAKGFLVTLVTTALDRGNYPTTVIIDYTGGRMVYTLDLLAKRLGLDPAQVKQGDPTTATRGPDGKAIDIRVVAGDDRLR